MSVIYGKNAVQEAIKKRVQINKILIQNGMESKIKYRFIDLAKKNSIAYIFVDKSKLDEMANNHQGIVAIASSIDYCDIDDLTKNEGLVVMLDGITDTHNMGAIIRSAYAFGANGIVIANRRSAMVDGTVFKTSAGAAAHLPIAKTNNLMNAINKFKENSFWVYCADINAEKSLYETNFSKKTLIIIGSEDKGVSKRIIEESDFRFIIPMNNFDSLNASVAAGIVFYEFSKKANYE